MNYSILSNRIVGNRCLDSFIHEFSSSETLNMELWVSCQFSIHPGQEHLIALGSESGLITLVDARYPHNSNKFVLRMLRADSAVVLGFCYVPSQENLLVELSGSGHIRVWDLCKSRQSSACLTGHEMGVRCVSVWPENPHCIITGSKDGCILAWDIRELPKSQFLPDNKYPTCYTPIRTINSAHRIPLKAIDKTRRSSISKDLPTITGILHIDRSLFISSSSSASSGLRIWDLRYQKLSTPLQTLSVPQRSAKESGITSLCWDRFHSNFFASCTDNCIYEYNISTGKQLPVRTLNSHNIDSVYVQCAASPVSDHLLAGTSDNHALIWDLQEQRHYKQDYCFLGSVMPRPSTGYLPRPKFQLGGHKNNVEIASWSSKANYIATLDEANLRIWSKRPERTQPDGNLPTEFIVEHRPVQLLYPKLLDLP